MAIPLPTFVNPSVNNIVSSSSLNTVNNNTTLSSSNIPLSRATSLRNPLTSSTSINSNLPFTSVPPVSKNSSFKYVEVVRKQSERDNLHGYSCLQCGQFFRALEASAQAMGQNILPYNEERLCQCASRHRSKFLPDPSTPPGYWDLDNQELEGSPIKPIIRRKSLINNPDK